MSKMFARHRDFLYKRSQRAALLGRASPLTAAEDDASNKSSVAPTPSVDPKTSDVINSLTPPGPVTKPTDTPTTSPDTPSSPTPTTSSSRSPSSPSPSPSSSSSLGKASPSTSTPSSATTRATPSIALTASSVVPSPSLYTSSGVTTQVVPGVSFTPSSTLSSTPTSASTSSSGGTNTGVIIGGIAGTLAGIVVFGLLLMWCMRRQRDQDIDDFDAQAFKRQSAMLVDDPVEPSRSYNPRPPTMIERHNASPALAAQTGYGGQNFYGSYGGYSQQAPYAPPETIQSAGSPPPQAYGAPPMGYTSYNNSQQIVRQPSNAGHTTYGGQQQLARQPSNAAYLTPQPSSAAGYAPPVAPPGSFDPNAQYIDLNRSSVSPYQAAQYADISRQLGTTDPNAQVPHGSLALPEDPLPSPFDDPVDATPNAHHHLDYPADVVASGPITTVPAPQKQGNVTEPHQRPITVYEEGDAYGGI